MTTNAELLARRRRALPRGIASATPLFAGRAENGEVWDVEGNRFIDFAAGIAVLNTGHRHPAVVSAVRDQLDRYTHTAFQVIGYEPFVALAERLNGLAPIAGDAKTLLLTTGAEAVENAVKIARAATGRPAIIALTGGFHGRTLLSLALTGKVVPYKHAFGPLPGDIYHIPMPIPHYGVSVEDSLRALEALFRADVEPSRVAAIIVEPVQGEGGFHVAPADFLRALKSRCEAHGILFIADEIQTGFGRTGRMFAVEHAGLEPDLITVAKSLAGGFPLSGVIGRAAVMDSVEPGGLGGTYAGSPVACAAALAVLDAIEGEDLCARASQIGDHVRERLAGMQARPDLAPMAAIRGLGAMIAFDLVAARGAHDPDPAAAKRVAVRTLKRGLVVLTCGIHGETIRLLMPLTISDALLDEGLDRLEGALET